MASNLTARLARLMEDMGWLGHTNWSKVQDSVLQKHIPEFKNWLRLNLKYIRQDRAREFIRQYYFENAEVSSKGGGYTYLDLGRSALWALYQKERDNG